MLIPYGNQTWQSRKKNKISLSHEKPPFIGSFPASHVMFCFFFPKGISASASPRLPSIFTASRWFCAKICSGSRKPAKPAMASRGPGLSWGCHLLQKWVKMTTSNSSESFRIIKKPLINPCICGFHGTRRNLGKGLSVHRPSCVPVNIAKKISLLLDLKVISWCFLSGWICGLPMIFSGRLMAHEKKTQLAEVVTDPISP